MNIELQWFSMMTPIISEPMTLPSLPNIIEMQTAIDRILVRKSSTVDALTTLMANATSSISK
jgi:hypothetical protein